MKKLLTIAAIVFASYASGQITLEHTYTNLSSLQVFNIEGEGQKYVGVDTLTKHVMIYNDDHSLWKTINTILPANSYVSAVTCISKNFFDNDAQVELAYQYYTSGSPATWTTVIYNEDGTTIITLNDVNNLIPFKVNGIWKAIGASTKGPQIYSVPGQWTGIKAPNRDDDAVSMIYPNPMNTAATVQYSLPAGTHQAQLQVYNSNGVLMRSYQVTDQWRDVQISRDDLPPGVYYYQLQAPGIAATNRPFVIN